MNAKDITVIIPFRNESNRLNGLFESISNLAIFPKVFIFVDDHSEDDGAYKVVQFANQIYYKVEVSVLSLNKGVSGKKAAIAMGVKHANSSFLLFMDADLTFSADYFDYLPAYYNCDMVVLPVVMQAQKNNLISWLSKIEHLLFNSTNYILAGFYVLSANGANLLVKKVAYENAQNINLHKHYASGDDYFLLRLFQKNGLNIAVSNNHKNIVFTESVKSFSDYFFQRLRWIGKINTPNRWELLMTFFSVFYFLLPPLFLLLVLLGVQFSVIVFLFVSFLRWILDYLFIVVYLKKESKGKIYFWLLIFQLVYPFLYISIAIAKIFYQPKWKGRKISD